MVIAILAAVAAILIAPIAAEAARCPAGQVYRASLGVCQSKAHAIRAGVYKPRRAARVRSHRATRVRHPAPVPRAIDRPATIRITRALQFEIDLKTWAERNRSWIVEAGR